MRLYRMSDKDLKKGRGLPNAYYQINYVRSGIICCIFAIFTPINSNLSNNLDTVQTDDNTRPPS